MAPYARIASIGGGINSLAMVLDAIDRGEPPDICVFIDVADGGGPGSRPGEWPGTYRHLNEVFAPLCARHGIEFVWINHLDYPVRDAPTLFDWMWARGQIPVAGPNRLCTKIAKVERFERWMGDRYPAGSEIEVWIGFDAGEERRAEKDPNAGSRRPQKGAKVRRVNRFPLIEAKLCRCRCEALVRKHGLPLPRKSACVFCPYGSLSDWQTFARELPEQFAEVAELEARKPPTEAGFKLSIMGFNIKRDTEGNVLKVRAPPLPVYIQGRPLGRRGACEVCGAPQRATKATGCDYLEEAPT